MDVHLNGIALFEHRPEACQFTHHFLGRFAHVAIEFLRDFTDRSVSRSSSLASVDSCFGNLLR
jgi:hypothetical protein